MPITQDIVEKAALSLPAHMQDGAIGYVLHGWEPGGFLTAVLLNDLISAAERADEQNARALYAWAVFVYNAVPVGARGSTENIMSWMAAGGLNGQC